MRSTANNIISNDLSKSRFSKEILQKPNFTGWNLANFCEHTSRGGVDQFMPIFGSMLGGSAAEIGLMTGAYSLKNIFQFLWALVSARLGKLKIFVVMGWIISSLLFIPMILLKRGQMVLLIIIRFIQGLFYSASPPAQSSLLAEHIPLQERAAKISTFTRIGLLGAFLGTLIGGIIFSLFSDSFDLRIEEIFILLFLWSLLLGLFASMMFYTSVPEYRYHDKLDPSLLIHQHVVQASSPSRLNLFEKILAYSKKFSNFWKF
jgi:MFS family permease